MRRPSRRLRRRPLRRPRRDEIDWSRACHRRISNNCDAWRCGSDDEPSRTAGTCGRSSRARTGIRRGRKEPFWNEAKSAADPRDEDVAFFYAEEANHDAEEAIFRTLWYDDDNTTGA